MAPAVAPWQHLDKIVISVGFHHPWLPAAEFNPFDLAAVPSRQSDGSGQIQTTMLTNTFLP
jgi:hypothetical protein